MSVEPDRPAGGTDTRDEAGTGNARSADADGADPGSGGSIRGAHSGSGGAPAAISTERTGGPLLRDAAGLRSSWHRVQAGFVDDPRQAVSDAAELVEHTVQALIGALRERQKALRDMWRRGPVDGASRAASTVGGDASGGDPADSDGAATADSTTETEHLRQMMLRYRTLFDQLSRP